jgi:hypothetical protein
MQVDAVPVRFNEALEARRRAALARWVGQAHGVFEEGLSILADAFGDVQ